MIKVVQFFSFILIGLVLASFAPKEKNEDFGKNVKWYTWEEAVAANKKVKKKIFH